LAQAQQPPAPPAVVSSFVRDPNRNKAIWGGRGAPTRFVCARPRLKLLGGANAARRVGATISVRSSEGTTPRVNGGIASAGPGSSTSGVTLRRQHVADLHGDRARPATKIAEANVLDVKGESSSLRRVPQGRENEHDRFDRSDSQGGRSPTVSQITPPGAMDLRMACLCHRRSEIPSRNVRRHARTHGQHRGGERVVECDA